MLQKGFSGTSLDEIISAANITKDGFFYHFDSKNDLAKHLMLKYQHDDEIFFNSLFDRADELSEVPLQQMLIFLSKEIKDREKNEYAINCRLDVREFGVRTLEPEDFKITRTEDGQNWISYPSILRFYTEVYLHSDKGTDIIKMVCQEYGDQTDRNFTVAEMQDALGDIFTFKFATEN